MIIKIDYYVSIYDFHGSKEHLGHMSHRSVINALKRFKGFCDSEIFKDINIEFDE